MDFCWNEDRKSNGCTSYGRAEYFNIERRSYEKTSHPSGGGNLPKGGAWMLEPNNLQGNRETKNKANLQVVVNKLKIRETKNGESTQHNYVPNVFNGAAWQPTPNTSANIFSQLSDMTTSVVEQAKAIWRAFVSAITSLAKWVMESVTDLWNSAVDAVKNISRAVANFLKKFWRNEEEFVRRMQKAPENVKECIVDGITEVGEKATSFAVGHMKTMLRRHAYAVESMSEEAIKNCWKEYRNGSRGMTPQEEAEADALLNGPQKKERAANAFSGGRSCNYASARFVSCNYSSNISSCDYSSPGMSYHSSEMSSRVVKKARPLTAEEEAEADLILNGPSN